MEMRLDMPIKRVSTLFWFFFFFLKIHTFVCLDQLDASSASLWALEDETRDSDAMMVDIDG